MTEWRGIVDVAYGTIILAEPGSMGADEGFDVPRLMEEHCQAIPAGVHVSLPERDVPVETHVRVLAEPAPIEPDWEHVAEVGFRAPAGRLQVYSWMPDEDLAAELDVPSEPLIARIHWAGLEQWLRDLDQPYEEGPGPVQVRIDLFPAERDGVGTLRMWHGWAPPVHESVGPDGLRRFRGAAVGPNEAALQSIGRMFVEPYPTIDEGTVHALLRNPADGSRWANGYGPRGFRFLKELSAEDADTLEAETYEEIDTFARDADGQIWASTRMPLERASVLALILPDRWRLVEALLVGTRWQLVELPAGWSRITRRPRDGSGSPVLVDRVGGDTTDGFYQRWRDGTEIE